MSWKKLIEHSFGTADKNFASHTIEIKNAQDLLYKAAKDGVGLAEFLATIEEWLKKQNCSEEHILLQKERILNVSNYFIND